MSYYLHCAVYGLFLLVATIGDIAPPQSTHMDESLKGKGKAKDVIETKVPKDLPDVDVVKEVPKVDVIIPTVDGSRTDAPTPSPDDSSTEPPTPCPPCGFSRGGPIGCLDETEKPKLKECSCHQWYCEHSEVCYTWSSRAPSCEHGEAVRNGCTTFKCGNRTVDGQHVMMAGRIYLPEAGTSAVRSFADLDRQEGTQSGRAPLVGDFRRQLLSTALQALELEKEPIAANSTLDIVLDETALRREMEECSMQTDWAQVVHNWTEQARDEHASVAAFALLQLELLAHGAPSDLIARTLQASQEELAHVTACEMLSGKPKAYLSLALPEHELQISLHKDHAGLVSRSLREGAAPEGHAAVKLWGQAHAELSNGRPARAKLLWAMGHDEARHAELAHDIAVWAAASGGVIMPIVSVTRDGIKFEESTQMEV